MGRMARWFAFIALVALSSGWVVPLYFSVQLLVSWCRLEAAPVIYGTEGGGNSFPFLAEAEFLWLVTSVWLAIVSLFWSAVAARNWLFTREGK